MCHKCGQPGHFIQACPKLREQVVCVGVCYCCCLHALFVFLLVCFCVSYGLYVVLLYMLLFFVCICICFILVVASKLFRVSLNCSNSCQCILLSCMWCLTLFLFHIRLFHLINFLCQIHHNYHIYLFHHCFHHHLHHCFHH